MKRVLTSMTVWALAMAFSPIWVTGCSVDASEKTEATGTLDLGLTGTSQSGRTYRLRNGTIKITGTATATVLTEEHLNETSVALEVKAGGYLAKLNTGWTMERGVLDPMTNQMVFENVKAVLISTNPLPFVVNDQLTTQVRFQFNAGDEVVKLGNGRVVLGFDVNDCIGAEAIFCDADGDGFPPDQDCDDNNPEVFPGAPDFCDGLDNNCDGIVDEFCGCPAGDPACDNDGDGFPGFDDCNDFDPFINPGQPDFCDMVDNNCNGLTDEGCGGCDAADPGCDNDGDGFPANIDCNDSNSNVFPGALEFCDMQDNNCDGLIDEVGCGCDAADPNCDNDGDGFPANVDCNDFNASVFPGAADVCDGQDNDCDGIPDQGCVSCSILTQTGCGPTEGCYLTTSAGESACLPSGFVPTGGPCNEMLLNECVAPAVCTGLNGPPRCHDLCDLGALTCPNPGETCLDLGISNLGVCL